MHLELTVTIPTDFQYLQCEGHQLHAINKASMILFIYSIYIYKKIANKIIQIQLLFPLQTIQLSNLHIYIFNVLYEVFGPNITFSAAANILEMEQSDWLIYSI